MAEKKHSVLALLEILRNDSDRDHILSSSEIRKKLSDVYGLDIERRTLYSNIDMLEGFGYKISRYEENGKGYYLEERQFEKGEILLLANAVHASHFIPQRKSEAMIRKLLATQSRYEREEFTERVYMPNPKKTRSPDLLRNISLVSEAIRKRKELQFTYMRYDLKKKLVPRREEVYIVEPRYIVYADSRAYMVVTSKTHEGYAHYRLDRIAKISLRDEKADPLPRDTDAYEYARNRLFMYGGETSYVEYRCKTGVLDHMIDLFGEDLFLSPVNEEYFDMRIRTSRTAAKFLAQQYLGNIEILEPEDLRTEFAEELETALTEYRRDK